MGQVDDDGDIAVAPLGVVPHRGDTSSTRAKCAGESSTPRTSAPSKRWGIPAMICSIRGRIALLAVCREIPRAAAVREIDMRSRARARIPHSTAKRVSRARGWARAEVSYLHRRRQVVQAKRHRRTSGCVALSSSLLPTARGTGAEPPSHEPAPGSRRPCRTGPQTQRVCGTRSPRAWL